MRRAAAVMVNVKKLEREKPAVGSLKLQSGATVPDCRVLWLFQTLLTLHLEYFLLAPMAGCPTVAALHHSVRSFTSAGFLL